MVFSPGCVPEMPDIFAPTNPDNLRVGNFLRAADGNNGVEMSSSGFSISDPISITYACVGGDVIKMAI
jgi:hypothetical protein